MELRQSDLYEAAQSGLVFVYSLKKEKKEKKPEVLYILHGS